MVISEEQKQKIKDMIERMFVKEEEILKREPTEEELAEAFKVSKETLDKHLSMIGETYESIRQDAEEHVRHAVATSQEPSEVVKEDEMRRRIMQFLAVLKQVYEALEGKLQRAPTISEVASVLKMPESELNQVLGALGIKLEDLKKMPSPTALSTEQDQIKQVLGILLLAVNRLYKKNNRDPTIDEVAAVLGIPIEKLEKVLSIFSLPFAKLVEEGKKLQV